MVGEQQGIRRQLISAGLRRRFADAADLFLGGVQGPGRQPRSLGRDKARRFRLAARCSELLKAVSVASVVPDIVVGAASLVPVVVVGAASLVGVVVVGAASVVPDFVVGVASVVPVVVVCVASLVGNIAVCAAGVSGVSGVR